MQGIAVLKVCLDMENSSGHFMQKRMSLNTQLPNKRRLKASSIYMFTSLKHAYVCTCKKKSYATLCALYNLER